jgi:hypothetical protein
MDVEKRGDEKKKKKKKKKHAKLTYVERGSYLVPCIDMDPWIHIAKGGQVHTMWFSSGLGLSYCGESTRYNPPLIEREREKAAIMGITRSRIEWGPPTNIVRRKLYILAGTQHVPSGVSGLCLEWNLYHTSKRNISIHPG